MGAAVLNAGNALLAAAGKVGMAWNPPWVGNCPVADVEADAGKLNDDEKLGADVNNGGTPLTEGRYDMLEG